MSTLRSLVSIKYFSILEINRGLKQSSTYSSFVRFYLSKNDELCAGFGLFGVLAIWFGWLF
jgi:hypothetical protein